MAALAQAATSVAAGMPAGRAMPSTSIATWRLQDFIEGGLVAGLAVGDGTGGGCWWRGCRGSAKAAPDDAAVPAGQEGAQDVGEMVEVADADLDGIEGAGVVIAGGAVIAVDLLGEPAAVGVEDGDGTVGHDARAACAACAWPSLRPPTNANSSANWRRMLPALPPQRRMSAISMANHSSVPI